MSTIGTPEWFEEIPEAYRHVAQAWLLGAQCEWQALGNKDIKHTWMSLESVSKTEHGNADGYPFFMAGETYRYRIKP